MKKIISIFVFCLILGSVFVWRAEVYSRAAERSINATIAAPIVTTRARSEKVYVADAYKNVLAPARRVIVEEQEEAPARKPPAAAPAGSSVSVNLAVPFVSQAPLKIWDLFHEEACEEAAMYMVDKFITGEKLPGLKKIDQALHDIVEWEKENIGRYEDTDAEEIAKTLREYFGLKNVRLVYDPTVSEIKGILSGGEVVILPADGKILDNPNFRNGGPPYHVVVVRGYDGKGKWITNDPGTRLGEGFLYPEDNLMEAMHDYVAGDMIHGKKVIVVIGKN